MIVYGDSIRIKKMQERIDKLEKLAVSFYMDHDEVAMNYRMDSAKKLYKEGEEIHLKRERTKKENS